MKFTSASFFRPNLILRFGDYFVKKKRNGFTMIELLIVLTVVALLTTGGLVGFQASQRKSRDAARKADLQRVKVAVEDYYNDNGCYPIAGSFDACGSTALQPYLQMIPCDPVDDSAYLYLPLLNECQGYRIHTRLETDDDIDIMKVGCDLDTGCGYDADYNYGVASGVPVYDAGGPAAN